MSTLYKLLDADVRLHHPDASGYCGPLAIAALADLDAADMVTYCKQLRLWRSGVGMSLKHIRDTLAALTGKPVVRHDKPIGVKTMTTAERYMPRKGKFLLFTRNHVAAMVDGELVDWTQGRRHRILAIYRLEG